LDEKHGCTPIREERMKNLAFVLVAILTVSSAFAFSSDIFPEYEALHTNTQLYGCVQLFNVNTTGEVRLKANVEVDAKGLIVTRASCRDGIRAYQPYDRYIWVNTQKSYSRDLIEYSFVNTNTLSNTFSSSDPDRRSIGILYLENFVEYKLALSNPTNTANGYLKYDTVRGVDYKKDDAFFYYAIANNDARGLNQFYNTNTNTFADEEDFDAMGLPYPLEDLSNPNDIATAGVKCDSNYQCVYTRELDTALPKPGQKAFFAFSNDLQYYYYPFYIEKLEYSIRGYDTNGTGRTQNFYKTGTINPTSSKIKIPANNIITTNDFSGSVQEFIMTNDAFNFGSELKYDGSIATVPSGTTYTETTVWLYFKFNPWYRHESPADATWSFSNLSTGTCEMSNVCGLTMKNSLGFVLEQEIATNHATESNDIPPTNLTDINDPDPGNDFNNTQPTNSSSPPTPNGGIGNGTSGNGTGVDWSRDPSEGGGLQGQLEYAKGKIAMQNKATFFESLQEIALTILEIILTVFMLLILGLSIYLFLIMIPSGYRKLLNELKKLGDMRWK
jgi:hypothetical protein